MADATLGVLHPGEVGAALGAALREAGTVVLWASSDRSAATARRAEVADLRDVGSVDEPSGRTDLLLSVCPPHAALGVARSQAAGEPKQPASGPRPAGLGSVLSKAKRA
jgi:prephenate dehydrogenase